ncbi:hypothetical protein QQS21_010873 [Conoideocrella luteorostrata]|uniref:NACHT domain-containing protein n=1 Tax=Conoideocrella luteorostrata TaxID=1105319 RepID=A0AAJ0FU92_9HYPO|nr:hypothetical protein QQS21_010873 [Conoideocrella luteorostrata]
MAMVMGSLAPIKVESRLQQAIDAFIHDLTPVQRGEFLQERQECRQRYPDENDVLVFVAKLNHKHAAGKQRCYGPRFFNIIQVVQQFTAMGDALVGGSQNMIASGIWAIVRMALLLAAKANSNMDKLSHIFMIAGQSAPRYEAMSRLYGRKSKRLLSYYNEYFLVLVEMCHQLIQIANKPHLSRLFSTISDADVATFQEKIAHWGLMINEETMLLVAQGVEDQSSRLNALLDLSSAAVHRKRGQDNARVLTACSTYDHQATWKRIRKMGTTNLFNASDDYASWRGDSSTMDKSRSLIYTGKLGSGKSVLMANVIEDLNLRVAESKVPVVYFFCQHDDNDSLKARSIFGSLAKQLLQTLPDLSKAVELLPDDGGGRKEASMDEIVALLKHSIPVAFKAYCIIDGLDECDDLERRMVVVKLRELQELFTLRVCFSFRLEADNALRLYDRGFINCTTVAMPDNHPEMEQFIIDELERCVDSELLTLGDPTLVTDIMQTLLDLSQGMFLWVALQISSLCACKTDDDIRQTLANIPKDLAETFTRVLNKCEPTAKRYQKQILELVLVAQRPLTTEELREALGVTPGDTNWNPAKLPNNIYSVLASCGGLLTVDEETLRIRMVHQSARDFLIGDFEGRSGNPILVPGAANTNMARIVVTYLNYGIFDTQLSQARAPLAVPALQPSTIIQSRDTTSSTVKNLSLMLLRAKKSSASFSIDLPRVVEDIRGQAKQASRDHAAHRFYTYATSNLVQHIVKAECIDQPFIALVSKLVRKHALGECSNETKFEFLRWAALRDNNLYAQVYAEAATTTPCLDGILHTWATRRGYVYLLQTHHAVVSPLQVKQLAGLLPLAALNGHDATLDFILNLLGGDLPRADLVTTVMMAISGDYCHMVNLLLTGEKDPGALFAQPDSVESTQMQAHTHTASTNKGEPNRLAVKGHHMLHGRLYSRKLLLWANLFDKAHMAQLLIDLGAKTTDALQPKLEEELMSQTNDYSESVRQFDLIRYQILGDPRDSMLRGGANGGLQRQRSDEQQDILIRAARILAETRNVSLLNSFLIASQKEE